MSAQQRKRSTLGLCLVLFLLAIAAWDVGASLAGGLSAPAPLKTQIWQSPTPTPEPPELSASEVANYVPVAMQVTHPDARLQAEAPYTAQSLLDAPELYDLRHVVLQGNVVNVQRIERLQSRDWPVAYLLTLDDGTAWIPVLYRGHVGDLSIGGEMQVSGMFVAAGSAIHADVVRALLPATLWYTHFPPGMLPALGAVVLLGLVALALLVGQNRLAILLLGGLLLGGLSACDFTIETLINPDGSAVTSVQLSEDVKNTEFLRKIPGLKRYMDGWIEQMRSQGMGVEKWVSGNTEHLVMEKRHTDLASLSALNPTETTDSWVYATTFEVGDAQCYRYIARVDPTKLSTTPPGTDSAADREIKNYFSDINFTYAVTLPGRVRYSNARSVEHNRVEWHLDMDRTHELVAESCLGAIPETPDWRWIWLALAGACVIDLGLWSMVLLARKRNSAVNKNQLARDGDE